MKKRILALILIVAMLAALGLNAGAAAGTGTISFENLNDGESYTVYKVFDIEYNETTGAYRYVLPDEFSNFLDYKANLDLDNPAKKELMSDYFSTTTSGGKTYVSASFDSNSSESAVAAQLVKSYLDFYKPVTGVECTETLNNKEYGYYLLESSVGNICALGTLVPASVDGAAKLTLREKNLPGGIGGGGVDKEYVADGEKFTYTLTIVSPERGKNFTIHDYSKDIKIDEDSVKITGVDLESGPIVTINGSIFSDPECPPDCNMHIKFSTTAELEAYTKIQVTYTATKNGPNPTNGAIVSITDVGGGNVITPPTAIEPSSFALVKTEKGKDVILNGATFIVRKEEAGKTYYAKFAFNGTTNYSFKGWSESISDETKINVGGGWIKGLPAGTFYLDEIEAPVGYIGASAPVVITITKEDDAHVVSLVSGDAIYDSIGKMLYVPNTPGNPLPETGGIGTTVFYVVGGLLVLGAVVILLMKKRGANE